MNIYFWIFASTLIITTCSIFFLQPLSHHMGLLDWPDTRKQHQGAIPLVGGIGVFLGVATTLLLFPPLTSNQLVYLLSAGAIVILGATDDRLDISAGFKLGVQSVITLLMCLGSGLYIYKFGNLLGFGDITLPWFGMIATLLAVIGAINAFNMLDGIDGLIGINSIITFTAIGFLLYRSEHWGAFYLSAILVFALLPYLLSNLTIAPFHKKIFMGDAGSMLIGLSVVWLLLHGSQRDDIQSFRPVTALWIIAVPLMDMAAIMIRRIRKGQSPFQADRDHLHHIFMRAGFSPAQTLIIISLASVIFALTGIAGELLMIPEAVMMTAFLLLFLLYNHAIKHSWKLTKFAHRLKKPEY